MNLIVKETATLLGRTTLPGSKSQSIRGLILALLSKGKSTLLNMLDSDDVRDAINVCQHLGASIIVSNGNKTIIEGEGLPLKSDANTIHSGNSGITTRFILPLLGLRQNTDLPIILDCGEQMRARAIQPLIKVLTNFGLTIKYLKYTGALPISITGRLKGGIAEVDGTTSQYLSALLIALPCADADSEIRVRNLHERPYVEMTLNWLKDQKIIYNQEHTEDMDIYYIKGNQRYECFDTKISGDFSSASYLIAAAALIKGHVELEGLNLSDPQGDKRLITILQEMGADIVIKTNSIMIRGGKALKGLKIDAIDIPDLLPTLAVIGTYAEGKTEICNVSQARMKETDRIHSMTEGLMRLGAEVDEERDGMIVYQSKLQGAQVKGYGDHRTVMALSLAGMLAKGTTVIEDCEAINKTFPKFIEIMQSIGAKMEAYGKGST